MSYEALLEDIDKMQKSVETTDDDLGLPPEEEEEDGGAKAKKKEGKPKSDEDKETEGDEELFTKSTVKLEDGTEAEVFDGEALIKSFQTKIDSHQSETEGAITGTIDLVKSLVTSMADQAGLIKSLTAQVGKLSSAPAGRKAVLAVHEKKSDEELKKSLEPEGIDVNEFRKLLTPALLAKSITASEAAHTETLLNNGQSPSEEIVKKVMNV